MPVLNTASPKVSPSAPYARPWNARPSSRTSRAGRSVIAATSSSVPHPLEDDPRTERHEGDEGDDAGQCAGPCRALAHTSSTQERCRLRPLIRPPPRPPPKSGAGFAGSYVLHPAHHPNAVPASPAHAGLPSTTVGWPRRNVATTRAGSSRPAYGVLRLRLALSDGSTVQRASASMSTRFAGAPACNG